MWQRIQTIYLALATGLLAAMFFCNKADDVSFISYYPYLILMIIVVLLNLLALTSYKHRIFQMRTAILSAIITVALQAWIAVDFLATHSERIFHVAAIFPIVAVILDILAARAIFSDELMVRSAGRLRGPKKKR
ncbi:MAG: DUF4293 domain-containing protein [Bacteroidales bacterium]|nr:DUF4293 domain-containing protein [Bacteroidales bacterium]